MKQFNTAINPQGTVTLDTKEYFDLINLARDLSKALEGYTKCVKVMISNHNPNQVNVEYDHREDTGSVALIAEMAAKDDAIMRVLANADECYYQTGQSWFNSYNSVGSSDLRLVSPAFKAAYEHMQTVLMEEEMTAREAAEAAEAVVGPETAEQEAESDEG